ncbi:MAG: HIT family protein [Gammaproteobacteria bacterium]
MPTRSKPRRFKLDPQLVKDCHLLGELGFCHLLLHRNAVLPWFILVPETHLKDLLDLPAALRSKALDDATQVSRFIKKQLGYPKVNFAAIGNIVPQLHLHVIGRREGDPCWPAPVWGHLQQTSSYSPQQIEEIQQGIKALN